VGVAHQLLERDHVVGNVLDEVAALRARVDELEKRAMIGQIGPYTTTAPAAAGYVTLIIYVNGTATTYKLLAAV